MGYTVVKGNLREVNPTMRAPELPVELLKNCKMYPSRTAVLSELPKNMVMAEVGVAYGDFTEILLRELQPKMFYALDLFEVITQQYEPWGRTTLSQKKMTHREFYESRFKDQIAQGKMEVRQGFSWDALATFPDQFFDFIYLDAAHDYVPVVKDIEQMAKKIKPNGIMQFNDYGMFDPIGLNTMGVSKAVNEFMIRENYEMTAFCMQGAGFYDVVIRKKTV